MERILAELRSVHTRISENITPAEARFENVIQPLLDVDNRTQGGVGVIAMLRYASPDKLAREASDAACKLYGEFFSAFTAKDGKDIQHLAQAVNDLGEGIDNESAKCLETLLRDFRRTGIGLLDSKSTKEYLETSSRIHELCIEYNRNIRDENGTLRFSLEDLDGIPRHELDRFQKASENAADVDDIRIADFSRATLDAIMSYAKKPATRKRAWVANANKLPQNVALFEEIIRLRGDKARLLGYDDHATFRLEARVAKTTEWVNELLGSLEHALLPRGKTEIAALLELKNKDPNQQGQADLCIMRPWDYQYYARLAEENLELDQGKISEYFPLTHVVPAMLDVFASCLQIRFTPIQKSLLQGCTWHEDVEAWSLWDDREDSEGEFIGYLYTDLLERPNKYKGNQCVNLQCVSALSGVA